MKNNMKLFYKDLIDSIILITCLYSSSTKGPRSFGGAPLLAISAMYTFFNNSLTALDLVGLPVSARIL